MPLAIPRPSRQTASRRRARGVPRATPRRRQLPAEASGGEARGRARPESRAGAAGGGDERCWIHRRWCGTDLNNNAVPPSGFTINDATATCHVATCRVTRRFVDVDMGLNHTEQGAGPTSPFAAVCPLLLRVGLAKPSRTQINPEIQIWENVWVVQGCSGLSFHKLFPHYLSQNVLFCEMRVILSSICSKKITIVKCAHIYCYRKPFFIDRVPESNLQTTAVKSGSEDAGVTE